LFPFDEYSTFEEAHVPTIHKSDVLYFNKYSDCGNGVMELISVVYNAADSTGDILNYVNIPWGNDGDKIGDDSDGDDGNDGDKIVVEVVFIK